MFKKLVEKLTVSVRTKPKNSIQSKTTSRFETVESIMNIPVPHYPKLMGVSSPVNNVEYILQRKATEFKKIGDMDRAIACLRRSNQIMPYSNFSYQAKDYMRLIKYLRLAERNKEADYEEEQLHKNHPELFDMSISNRTRYIETYNKCLKFKTYNIFISTRNSCPICSKYNRKTYSINKHGNYPLIPKILQDGNLDCNHIIGYNIDFN